MRGIVNALEINKFVFFSDKGFNIAFDIFIAANYERMLIKLEMQIPESERFLRTDFFGCDEPIFRRRRKIL